MTDNNEEWTVPLIEYAGCWTRDLPTEDGFYWYREIFLDSRLEEVILWSEKRQKMLVTGECEEPLKGVDVTGEFWSARLEVPE